MKLLTVGSMLLGTAVFASAQITQKGNVYNFRLNLTKGMSYTLKIVTEVPTPGQPKPTTMDTVTKTTVVDKKGDVATLNILTTGMLAGSNPKPQLIKVDSKGKVVSGQIIANQGVLVPPTPIKVGQSWKAANGVGSPMGTGSAQTTYTFKGLKTVNGQRLAEIGVKMVVTGGISLTMNGLTYISTKDGLIVKSDLAATMANPSGGKTAPIKLTVKVTRS